MRYQPQGLIRIRDEWSKKGLRFAFVPGTGLLNYAAANPSPIQVAGAYTKAASPSGLMYVGGSRAEFPVTLDANGGLTIISVWRSRAHYMSDDNNRAIIGTKTASNIGWTWGRTSAISGGDTGNLTKQSLTFQGVAAYVETNSTIESFVETPVAVRFNSGSKLISWFRFGAKSSPDTATGTPSVGGNIIFGAQGALSSNLIPWLDHAAVVLVFDRALSDADIALLTATANSPYQLFAAPEEEYEIVSAGGSGGTATPSGVAASALTGSASASGTAGASTAGVQASAGAGATSASGAAGASAAGVQASAQTGMVSASAGSTASPSGVSANASVTSPGASAGAAIAVSGVQASAQVGTVGATGAGSGSALPAGVSASAMAGTVTAGGTAQVLASGVSASASVGTAYASGEESVAGNASVAGVSAGCAVGSIAATAGAGASPSGVSTNVTIGQLIAAGTILIPGSAAPAGVLATCRVGTASAYAGVIFKRAPDGAGYSPRRNESQARPAQTGGSRPAALQRNTR